MTDGPPETSLSQQAYRALRQRIVTCEIPPGAMLTERELAGTTGFGLTPLRRALARLDHEGLVCTLPRAGYRVTSLDAAAVAELVDAWSVVGPEIVRRGLDAAGGPDRAELVGLLSRRAATATPADVLAFSETAARTFEILAAACGNRWLRATSDQLSAQMSRVWITLLRDAPPSPDLHNLIRRWNDRIAGHPLAEVRDELPSLITDSGRLAHALVAPGR